MQDNYLRKIYISAAALFAIIIATVLVIFLIIVPAIKNANRPAFLDILVAPVDASVTIDGEEYRNAVYEMKSGDYVATVSRDGFESAKVELSLERDRTTGLYVYLKPIDDDWGFYEQRRNQESLNALLRLNGLNSNGEAWEPMPRLTLEKSEQVDAIVGRFSIKSIMPIYVSICGQPATRMNCDAAHIEYQYSRKCSDKLCLVITGRSKELTENMLKEIKSKLTQSGYDFDDYKYTYIQDAAR